MIPRTKKAEIIRELEEFFNKAKAIYFTSVKGVKTFDLNSLRQKLKEAEAKGKVIKKTIIDLVFKRKGLNENWREKLEGSVMVNFALDDPILVAKTLKDFSKQNENFQILGGLLDNKFLTPLEVEQLATIPAKNILYGRLAGSLISPIQRLTYSLKSNISKLVFVLNNVSKK
jgi:large subunit ribosomal protein L10